MTTPSMNWRSPSWRRFFGGLSALALVLQIGCYNYLPLQTSVPATGKRIAVVLNDRGRATVGDRLGSMLDKVDGLFVQGDSMNITLEVYRTLDLKGNSASWTGERVLVPRDGITGYQEREFSKRKTIILSAVIVGAVVASMLMVNLDLFSPFTHDNSGGGTTGQSR